MAYQSKYYNLNSFASGWSRETFAWAVEQLETIARPQLLAICALPEIKLRFTGENWERTTPEEEIISALISDYAPSVLIQAIKSVRGDVSSQEVTRT